MGNLESTYYFSNMICLLVIVGHLNHRTKENNTVQTFPYDLLNYILFRYSYGQGNKNKVTNKPFK